MTRKPRWASRRSSILPLLLLLLFAADVAQAAGIGAQVTIRPAPPLDPAGPSGWLCQSKPYMPCHKIYPPNSCFQWQNTPDVHGFCVFIDGYEIDWSGDWWRCGGIPCDVLSRAPRLSAGPSISGDGTHWRLDVTFSEDGCTVDDCVALPIGELAPGEVAELLDADGTVVLSVPDTGFSLLTPGDAACQP